MLGDNILMYVFAVCLTIVAFCLGAAIGILISDHLKANVRSMLAILRFADEPLRLG